MSRDVLVSVNRLAHEYPGSQGKRAVDDISFSIREGETFGLVGESGCGKTTTGRMLVRLLDITSGSVIFDGQDITKLQGKELLSYRRQAQIIHNGVDTDKFRFDTARRSKTRQMLNIRSDDFVIGNVGRLHFGKNQDLSRNIRP